MGAMNGFQPRCCVDPSDSYRNHPLPSLRQAISGDDVDRLQEAVDELASATAPLAELMMNAVVRSTLEGKKMEEVSPEEL